MWGACFLLEIGPDNKTDFLWHWINSKSLNPACFIPVEQVGGRVGIFPAGPQIRKSLKRSEAGKAEVAFFNC